MGIGGRTGRGWQSEDWRGVEQWQFSGFRGCRARDEGAAEYADMSWESKIFDSYEPVDHPKSLIPEVLETIEPFSGTTGDHPGVDEAMEMICQGFCQWRFQNSTLEYWGEAGCRQNVMEMSGFRGCCGFQAEHSWADEWGRGLDYSDCWGAAL